MSQLLNQRTILISQRRFECTQSFARAVSKIAAGNEQALGSQRFPQFLEIEPHRPVRARRSMTSALNAAEWEGSIHKSGSRISRSSASDANEAGSSSSAA